MTKQEFETLTGLTVDDGVFVHINHLYMEAGEMSKEDFCEDLKPKIDAILNSEIVKQIVQKSRRQEEKLDRLHKEIHDLQAALLSAASDADSDTTWEKAAEALGIAEVIRYKMDNQLDLTAQERVYIINHLK